MLNSCNSSPKTYVNKDDNQITIPYYIDIENNINNYETTCLSRLGKELSYIPLETNAQSLIKRINEIQFSNNYIFISDFDRLLQFNREGKFVRQVGRNGKGPGEYIYVSGFCIDEKREKIYILAWSIKTILEYDFNGLFIRSFKISFETTQFAHTDPDNFVFAIPNIPQNPNSEFRLIVTDNMGIQKIRIKNHNRFYKKPPLMATKIPMYFFKDTLRTMESRIDTLNTFYDGKLVPYAIFNLGQTKMEPDIAVPLQNPERGEFDNRIKDKLWIWTISESNEYLFIKFNLGLSDSSKYGIFNKHTSETKFLVKNGFNDDIGIGIPFWPRYVYNDTLLVDFQDAYKILNVTQGTLKPSEKYENLIKVLSETSNPVLIVLR